MISFDLFGDPIAQAPPTQGIKYAGSKLKLLPQILALARKVKPRIVLDGFSGTTRVSQALAQDGYTVFSNDASVWSEVFATCYLLNTKPKSHYRALINHLNQIEPKDGWFTEHYGGDPSNSSSASTDGLKKPWQTHNTRRLDAIRDEIELLQLPATERCVLLSSLMLALDSVDSTLGHYAAYLNEWSPRSYNKLLLKVPDLFLSGAGHTVSRQSVFDVAPNVDVDLAYFDPPYGSNNEKMPPSRVRYAAYYHVWTTICLNDRPELFGKVKRRKDTSDSVSSCVFEDFRRAADGGFVAVQAIERLLRQTQAKHILLSYSSGGRATAEELGRAITSNGRLLDVVEVNHKKNVMADMRWTNEWIRHAEEPNREFLFLMEKR